MSFEELPFDVQREIIDWCIKEKVLEIKHEGQVYILPNLVQLTYFCEKDGISFPTRIYAVDLIKEYGFTSKIRCKFCRKWIYLTNKSAPTPNIISEKIKSKKEGLEKFI